MSLNAKQKRFAHEYSVDHNGAQAAIRAGYSEARARHTASRLLANVAVKQLVGKLDERKRDDLSIESAEVLEQLEWLYEHASELLPKIWKGQAVVYTDPEHGEEVVITEFRAPAVAIKALELMLRLAGLDTARSSTDVFGEVIYKLELDRDLSEDAEGVGAHKPSDARPVA